MMSLNGALSLHSLLGRFGLKNDVVFKMVDRECMQLYWPIIYAVKEFNASQIYMNPLNCSNEPPLLSWTTRHGWVKCNVDGSGRNRDCEGTCGGVLRDENGTWIQCFGKKLGACGVLMVELQRNYQF